MGGPYEAFGDSGIVLRVDRQAAVMTSQAHDVSSDQVRTNGAEKSTVLSPLLRERRG